MMVVKRSEWASGRSALPVGWVVWAEATILLFTMGRAECLMGWAGIEALACLKQSMC